MIADTVLWTRAPSVPSPSLTMTQHHLHHYHSQKHHPSSPKSDSSLRHGLKKRTYLNICVRPSTTIKDERQYRFRIESFYKKLGYLAAIVELLIGCECHCRCSQLQTFVKFRLSPKNRPTPTPTADAPTTTPLGTAINKRLLPRQLH